MTALAIRSGIPVSVWEREDPTVVETALDIITRKE